MKFTHLDENGKVKMVDISDKQITTRKATASGEMLLKPETIDAILDNKLKKGDVFACARVAGIMAAKKTSELIPLCHNINISAVEIDIQCVPDSDKIVVLATVSCDGKTGVEMEALTAVTGTCLCIYDMCKAIDKNMIISDIKLLSKTGGKSGDYSLYKEGEI